MKQVSLCHDLASSHRTDDNSDYMDKLMAEMPQNDLDGDKIYVAKAFKVDVKEADMYVIAQFRNLTKMAFFFYKRKKARWVTL
jgi:hypothetical protein